MKFYIVGLSTGHGCEITTQNCAYLDLDKADAKVKADRDKKIYTQVFTVFVQDPESGETR